MCTYVCKYIRCVCVCCLVLFYFLIKELMSQGGFRIRHFSKETKFFLLKNGIKKQNAVTIL